ncbi:MAG: PAS domain S-box protein [Chitinophagales bacterium]|nr:PAS domain S-box protein [Chitinophagales bacterium]
MTETKQIYQDKTTDIDWLHQIISTSQDLIVAVDTKLYIKFYNERFKQAIFDICGTEPCLGKSFLSLFAPGSASYSQLEQLWVVALAGNQQREIFEGCTKNGQHFKYEMLLAPIRSAKGEIIGGKLRYRNIQLDERLQHLEKDLEYLFNNLSDVIFSVDMLQEKVIHISKACESVYGYSQQAFLDRPFLWKECVHEDDKHQLASLLEQLRLGQKIKSQYRILHQDEGLRWLESTLTPSLDANGLLVRIDGLSRDISEAKKAELELLEATLLLNESLEAAPDGIFLVDMQTGKCCGCNEQAVALFGYTKEQLLETTPVDLSPTFQPNGERSSEKAEQMIALAMQGQRPVFEWVHIDAQGNLIDCEVRLSQICIPNKLPMLRGSVTNITDKKRAINELNESRKMFREFFESAPEAILVYDVELDQVVDFNERALKLFNYSRLELLGMGYQQLGPLLQPDGKPTSQLKEEALQKTFSGERVILEAPIIDSGGNEVITEIRLNPLNIPGRQLVRASFIDITARKMAESQRQELFKELMDYKYALDQSFLIAITDHKGVIKYVNDNFCKVSKYSARELIGQNFSIVNSQYHSKEFIRQLWRQISSGKVWKGEIRNRAKDGSYYWVDTVIVPFLDDEGKPYQYVSLRTDITQKKEAQDAYAQSEANLETIFDNTDTGYVMFDEGFNVVSFNKQAAIYVERDLKKTLTKNIHALELIPDDRKEQWEEMISQLKSLGGNMQYESAYPQADGSVNWYYIRLFTVKNPHKHLGYIMALNDTTPMKLAEQEIRALNEGLERMVEERTKQLLEANKDLEAFNYMVSHDLRNPLRGMNIFLSLIKDKGLANGNELLAKYLSNVETCSQEMDSLIEHLLEFSRIGRLVGNNPLELSQVNMTKVAIDVGRTLKQLEPNKAIELRVQDLSPILAEEKLIKMVWANLIGNAIKYSSLRDRITIEIACEIKGNMVEYSVKDNGVGFNMNHAKKLFQPFSRLHSQSEFKGTGAGLAIVQKIIKAHQGDVGARAEPDKGATFYFTLPIINA